MAANGLQPARRRRGPQPTVPSRRSTVHYRIFFSSAPEGYDPARTVPRTIPRWVSTITVPTVTVAGVALDSVYSVGDTLTEALLFGYEIKDEIKGLGDG